MQLSQLVSLAASLGLVASRSTTVSYGQREILHKRAAADNATADYTQANRPQIHYSPASKFMNDPNGLVYADGTYHLYYQYNPVSDVAGNQTWGHATSSDLLHWREQEIAIRPANASEGIFSGSAVVDANNTSGFFNSSTPPGQRLVAMYTLNTPTSQTQHVAYSLDNGATYVKYGVVIDEGLTQFRDPKVFWHAETRKWVVAIVRSSEYTVDFYSSPNLRDWTELSRFRQTGLTGYQWEVPELKKIKIENPATGSGKANATDAWVLFISINPGAPQGGSVVQYFVGEFDGTTFKATDKSTRLADFGTDWYASQTWSNLPASQGTVGLAWASNWQYAQVVPTSPWRSTQSLPRTLTLRRTQPNPEKTQLTLIANPISLAPLNPRTLGGTRRQESTWDGERTLAGTRQTGDTATQRLTEGSAWDLRLNSSSLTNSSSYAFLRIQINAGPMNASSASTANNSTGGAYISLFYQDGQLVVDRAHARADFEWSPYFTDKVSNYVQPLDLSAPGVDLRVIIDRGILEVYVNGGISVATTTYFFPQDTKPASVDVTVGQGMHAAWSVDALDSIWS